MVMQYFMYVFVIFIASHCCNVDGITGPRHPTKARNMDELRRVIHLNNCGKTGDEVEIGYDAMIQCLNPLIESNHLSAEATIEIYCSSKLTSIKACVYPYLDLFSGSDTSQKHTKENFVFDALLKFGCRKEDDKYLFIEFKKYSAQYFDGTSAKLSGLMQCIPDEEHMLESSTTDTCEQLHSIALCIKEKAKACCDYRITDFFSTLIQDVIEATPCELVKLDLVKDSAAADVTN